MRTITCMIVEDEPHAMQLLQDYISKTPFLQLQATCYDPMSAVAFLRNHTVDVIFLDINMPLLTGIEMAAMISKEQKIIFTTAYSEYALDSFEYHVIDYILKPVSFKRFMQAVNKLQPAIQQTPETESRYETTKDRFMFVKSGKQIHKIEFDAILYLEALKEYVSICTGKEKLLVYKRMKEMADVLPQQFVRIHNSYIINISQVKQMDNNMVEIGGRQLPVSAGYKELFQQRIKEHLV